MKLRNLHIVFSILVLVNLLFVQIIPDYLHNHEQGTKEICLDSHDQEEFHVDFEDCEMCSIDLFHDLFYTATSDILFDNSFENDWSVKNILKADKLIFSTTGRAPPIVFLS